MEQTHFTGASNEPTHRLGTYEVALLRKLVAIPTVTRNTQFMDAYLMNELATIPGAVISRDQGNIYVTKGAVAAGEFYPAVVAHTDTVHNINHNVKPFIYGDVLFAMDVSKWEQVGTGGDDKVGIFIAIMALRLFSNIKAAFFRDEESGCIGSNLADMKFFDDCGFVIQADRRGRYDVTKEIGNLPMLNQEFMDKYDYVMQRHNRTYVSGMMTDVQTLVRKGLKVCACNISCGYYEPHTSRETINLLHVQETLTFVVDLLQEVGKNECPFPDRKKEERKYTTYYDSGWNSRSDKYWKTHNGSSGRTSQLTLQSEDDKRPFRFTVDQFCFNCGTLLHSTEQIDVGACDKCIKSAVEMSKSVTDGK